MTRISSLFVSAEVFVRITPYLKTPLMTQNGVRRMTAWVACVLVQQAQDQTVITKRNHDVIIFRVIR